MRMGKNDDWKASSLGETNWLHLTRSLARSLVSNLLAAAADSSDMSKPQQQQSCVTLEDNLERANGVGGTTRLLKVDCTKVFCCNCARGQEGRRRRNKWSWLVVGKFCAHLSVGARPNAVGKLTAPLCLSLLFVWMPRQIKTWFALRHQRQLLLQLCARIES